ncbi:MAG: hypothetical protein OXT09_16310 [Myxococcales bacterium]|nr:hypothetical protein [Myxococcales bacterium]
MPNDFLKLPPRAAAKPLLALCLLWPAGVSAAALTLTPVQPGQIRVDGDVGEWRGARFVELGEAADSSIEYALGYDGEALYVAARVYDESLVRSRKPARREDAVVLALALPRAGGTHRLSEVWLYAGEIGRSPASGAVARGGGTPKAERAIQIVEGPLADGDGYVLEARVPWKVLPGGREHQIGRGALRLHDVDGKVGARPAVLASARGTRARSLPPLRVEGGANAALSDFLRQKGIGSGAIRRDLVGDAFGDGRLERVVVASTFAIVVGPDIQGGGGFHYLDLPVTGGAGVRDAALRDLTGDGKVELTLRLSQQNELGKREVFQVMALDRPEARKLLSLELRKQTDDGWVEAELRIGKGKPPTIEARIGEAKGLGPDNYREPRVQGVEPVLVPWGAVRRRVYRWDGTRFAVEDEEQNPDAHVPEPKRVAARAPADDGVERVASHPEPPGLDRLVAAFRRSQGLDPSARPRSVRHVNVAEDGRHESLMLFDAHLLVVGKGYRGGSGYFYFQLPVASGRDIQRLFTGDVTGDGRREVFVRFKQHIADVQREILLAYTFEADGGMRQILALEVRRAQGGSAVGNVVDLVPSGSHWALRIKPGRARGWSAGSYPFVSDASDGYGALLLPWNDRTARYRYREGRLLRSD